MTKPNILFILSDQQRWDTCGCYGQPLHITPHLDRMATDGVRFENAFTCQPVCGPARACLQTGKYATEIGCHTNHKRLPSDGTTLSNLLSGNGYEAGYIGKWHLASCGPRNGEDDFRDRPVPRHLRGGYDDYWLAADVLEFTSHSYDGHMYDANMVRRDFPEGRYRVDVLTDWTLEYLRTRSGETPFFLFLSYIEPHHQNDHGHFEGPHGSKTRFSNFVPPGDLANAGGNWREEYPDYLGCVHSLDENLRRIRAALEALDVADNTLIIYTSDHGSHFCTRNSEYKRSCHDGCIRIPMVACGPGFSGGKVVDELVSLIDLPPTVVTAGGVNPPESMRGRPLQELVSRTATHWPHEVFVQISESQCGRAIRTGRWKYSVRAPGRTGADANSDVYMEDFLYDLEADPHEQNNLASSPEHTEIRAELAARLKKRMLAAGENEPDIVPLSEGKAIIA
ncbi:MAG: arylsulfatase [Armatimonadetes bacterium CG2_30_59_28]|nr:sulfatase-like hydrolase/transferase [Armatimonadota bacterium]OIO91830.1 MAG: arylsulfatase [Armatimonadetes bacterium CG2_30_59_28]PIU63838.1 MAG: arylsulfatase [Armatimonadetes bacterium CG07_land_8_20_14_0_80_59_28]PIX42964.1 MAG: arylsulfatase [Armatimonadetes bacterium CG_4_8_14_3_um_filter_58_9]